MRTPLVSLCVLALVALALPAGPAAAATGWTPTQSFSVGTGYEPVPRAAVAADGTSVLAFGSKTGKLMLSTGDAAGRFTAPRPIDASGARDWSVAARADGGFIVAWEDADGIHTATRTRTGRPTIRRLAVQSNGEEINGVQVAADPVGGWALAERQFRKTKARNYYVRAMTLSAGGRLAGAVQDLGPGDFGIDARPTMSLAVDDAGRAVLAFVPESSSLEITQPTAVVSLRPHGGSFGVPVALSGDTAGDPRVAVGPGGRAMIAATQLRSRGDAGIFGEPVIARVDPAGRLGAPFGPAIANPKRAFGPTAAFTSGGRGVLVFSLKTSAQPFETRAPVRAVAISASGALGKLQTLTRGRAKEPVAVAVGGSALAMWSGERGLGASLAGATGTFKTTSVPKGPPPDPFHFNSTNRDLRTAGRYAIFTWSRNADGRVRISVRRF